MPTICEHGFQKRSISRLLILMALMVTPALSMTPTHCWLQYKCPFFKGFGALCTYIKFDGVPSDSECTRILETVKTRQSMRNQSERNWVLTWAPGAEDEMCTIDNTSYLQRDCIKKVKGDDAQVNFDLTPISAYLRVK